MEVDMAKIMRLGELYTTRQDHFESPKPEDRGC